MKLKSHFKFTTQQRNGIFSLIILIVIVQCIYTFSNFYSEKINVDSNELKRYQFKIDSLKLIAIENRKPKIYPFNPNFITDYKGYTLGMSNEEIDRLLQFRKQNQWVNSKEQFQQVTKISDSLLEELAPYFKFPEWVTKPKQKQSYISNTFSRTPKSEADKVDLNIATQQQLQKVYGVGEKLSERIVNYRTNHNGFISMIELQEVYSLSHETIAEIKKEFNLQTPKTVKKINLNTATKADLVTIQYIDYEIAHNIIEQRTLKERYNSIDELLKVKAFPVNKFEIIRLYLTLN